MNTVRNIRIATGIKRIELANENLAMIQIGDVLKQHRETLINRLLSDLSNYIDYKFRTPVKKDQLQLIRNKLLDLRNGSVNLARYGDVISAILGNENTYVSSELFYHEINEVIGEELNPSQLTLVK